MPPGKNLKNFWEFVSPISGFVQYLEKRMTHEKDN